MAKKETKTDQTINTTQNIKKKAKKRKIITKEIDEEVASKSLIVERMEDSDSKVVNASPIKVLKRKNKEKGAIKEKRSKPAGDTEDTTNANEHVDDDEAAAEPTMEQLLESEKPENLNAIVTVRQKKQQKHQQRLESLKDHTVNKERMRNEEYLRKWKHERAEWKFEKLRQISIQSTVFEEEKLSAEMWPIALEYLAGSKGAAKSLVIKLAEQCIDELDKQCTDEMEEEERKLIIDSTRYQRARDLLQSFD